MTDTPDTPPAEKTTLHLTDEVTEILSNPEPSPFQAAILDGDTVRNFTPRHLDPAELRHALATSPEPTLDVPSMRAALLGISDRRAALLQVRASPAPGPARYVCPDAIRVRNRLVDLLPGDFRAQHADDLDSHLFSHEFERFLHAVMAHTELTHIALALYWSLQATLRSNRADAFEDASTAFDLTESTGTADSTRTAAQAAMNNHIGAMGQRAANVLDGYRRAETRSGVYLVWMDDEHQVRTGTLADLAAWCGSNDREGGERRLVEIRAPYDQRTMLKLDWTTGGVGGGYDACDIGTACITVTLPYGTQRTAYWAVDGRA